MRSSTLVALILSGALLGCESYEAPPKIQAISLVRDTYDQDTGPLEIEFEKPLDPATLKLSLYLDRSNVEQDLCRMNGDALPSGCTEEAPIIAGPCERRPDAEFRLDDPSRGRAFMCNGATLIISPDETKLSVELSNALTPFERYVLIFEAGLSGADGRVAKNALVRRFQAAGAFALAPTSFEPGMFFTVFDVDAPVKKQFHFYFYLWVDQGTGRLQLFGADIDPNDETVVPEVNRNPSDWHTDPNAPTGASISANGQIADTAAGQVIAVFPFLLKIEQPAVEAIDTELTGKLRIDVVPEAPPVEREVVQGSMFAARVFLGAGESRAELGAGSGRLAMYRLTPEEAPPIEALLPDGVSLQDVLPPLTSGD
jgi:hypothetical protein